MVEDLVGHLTKALIVMKELNDQLLTHITWLKMQSFNIIM